MHNIIFRILFLSNLFFSPIIIAEENAEEELSISSMRLELRDDTNENQDYVPDVINELRKEIDKYPLNIKLSELKSFYCRDHPELVEEGICWCGTEDLLYEELLRIEKSWIVRGFKS